MMSEETLDAALEVTRKYGVNDQEVGFVYCTTPATLFSLKVADLIFLKMAARIKALEGELKMPDKKPVVWKECLPIDLPEELE